MKKKILSAVSASVLAAGVAVAVPDPASAAFSDCPTGQGCVFTGTYGSGSRLNLPFSIYGSGACYTFNVNWGNVISSVSVSYGGNHTLILYNSASCSTSLPSQGFYNVNDNLLPVVNNQTKSFRIGSF